MTPYKITVVGGGTAGAMAATYFKAYWGELADITIIYDHKRPGIGVGESLTPIFDNYLKTVGITTVELIKHCNATIKLGLKFTKWLDEGSEGWHSFPHNESMEIVDPVISTFCAIDGYEMSTNQYDHGYNYGLYYANNNLIPASDNNSYRHALHVDATLLSKYALEKFKKQITIIDGIVDTVNVESRSIKSIKLQDGREFTADIFIDASGFEKVLFKHLEVEWIDTSKYLPTNRTIPNPLFKEFDSLPCYTTAEASKNGWILDVPLSNRHGTGYIYCSEFTSDEQAKQEFNQWLLKKYNVELQSDRVIKFSSGYHKEAWVGNCVCIGLASSFVEPLEATNIHHTYVQIDQVTRLYHGTDCNLTKKTYNIKNSRMMENTFDYIRFFFHTGRQDSEFWKYMSNNIPDNIKDLDDLIKSGGYLCKEHIFQDLMFEPIDFNVIAYHNGLYKNKEAIVTLLKSKYLYDHSGNTLNEIRKIKDRYKINAVDHKLWIESIKEGRLY